MCEMIILNCNSSYSIDWSLIISIIALLSAFLFNWITYRFSKKQSIASVKPYLRCLWKFDGVNLSVKYTITNVGTGPMIINGINLRYNDENFWSDSRTCLGVVVSFFEKDNDIKPGIITYQAKDIGNNFGLVAGESLVLFSVQNIPNTGLLKLFEEEYLINLKVHVRRYEDIYGNVFVNNEK